MAFRQLPLQFVGTKPLRRERRGEFADLASLGSGRVGRPVVQADPVVRPTGRGLGILEEDPLDVAEFRQCPPLGRGLGREDLPAMLAGDLPSEVFRADFQRVFAPGARDEESLVHMAGPPGGEGRAAAITFPSILSRGMDPAEYGGLRMSTGGLRTSATPGPWSRS